MLRFSIRLHPRAIEPSDALVMAGALLEAEREKGT
jgi:hypothetical protein